MNQITVETIETAESWIELSNQKDIEGLSKLTDSKLELIGPKGIGVINHQELGEWLERANLKLATTNQYAKDHFIVLEQDGTWLNDDDTIKGQAIVYTVFKVVNQKVIFLARYDNKEEAFNISGLSDEERIN
ncbi:hypothetical protein JSQ81_16385 [Sporosarcina sp. Marseille-Q4063]|uniref:hypothetical protein n=1 Tax=Sporosarcina sp. Marseille-Q4063 TaxID=2810514 RepID=UPI001BAFE279|nr:hypothetical protein [Sporosarcina sp. Marseille-Q4063]QUW21366.1 hypothetical protein JSQ81_16385 [Sporosarcina sp. Marseille-Q4063]